MAQNRKRQQRNKPDDGFDKRLLNIRRVSRMYHGGRRMRFSAFVVAGDKEGRVGIGSGKALEVPLAQDKAYAVAKRSLIEVPLKGNTIPHTVEYKFKSTKVLLKPAAPGTGVVAGATVKAVAELAGIKDMLTKVFGSTNTINTANAVMHALAMLKQPEEVVVVNEQKPEKNEEKSESKKTKPANVKKTAKKETNSETKADK